MPRSAQLPTSLAGMKLVVTAFMTLDGVVEAPAWRADFVERMEPVTT